MSELLERLLASWKGPLTLTPEDLAFAMACSVGCGVVVSETYRRTHRGMDYSKPFVQVLVLIATLSAFLTLIVGDDLARAFTLVGALNVIRFRTAVKEPRDLVYIFWSVGVGMGAGCRFLTLTIEFTLAVAILAWLLGRVGYGVRDAGVKVLRVCVDSQTPYENLLAPCFGRFLADHQRLSVGLVRQGLLYELVYLVRLKPRATEEAFVEALRAITGNHPITLAGRDEEASF